MPQSSSPRHAVIIGLISAVVVAGFVRLGFWQLDRARQKHEAFALYEHNAAMPPADVTTLIDASPAETLWRAVSATGRFQHGISVLLDNQSHEGRPGYLVYAPFALSTGAVVLVNRGWLANDGHRDAVSVPSPPDGSTTILARFGKPPSVGIQLAGGEQVERLDDRLYRVQSLDTDLVAKAIGLTLHPQLLLQEGNAGDSLLRQWGVPASDEARHRSYAVQWFAMAAALVVINVSLLLRRRQ